MVAAHPFPRGHGRESVLYFFLFMCHGRDGARMPKMSHHGRDTQGKNEEHSMLQLSRP